MMKQKESKLTMEDHLRENNGRVEGVIPNNGRWSTTLGSLCWLSLYVYQG